jgi:mannose-6-phosphate isomerase-like protein (cupin superfamily)
VIHHVMIPEVAPREFPAGRATRIFAGVAGLPVQQFAAGQSTLYPGGGVPLHRHHNEEVYIILHGSGEMTVGDERITVSPGSAVYLPPGVPHALRNTGGEDLIVMWVYAPATVVDHWAEETREGRTRP